jgi:nucleotide-binding universal stress UspA family protein
MYRTILVPIDGSALSESAVPLARAIAVASQAAIVLLRVVPPADARADDAPAHPTAELQAAEEYLATLAARLGPPPTIQTALAMGDPATVILDEAARRSADLIVMSTHGRTGLGRFIYGSVADYVMRHATSPVLLVPADAHVDLPTRRPPRILVPLDGSPLAEGALGPAAELARSLGGELCLVRVVEPHPPLYGDPSSYMLMDPTAELDAARAYLQNVRSTLPVGELKVTAIDAFGFSASTLIATARQENVDVVAMSTHGNGGITRLIMGSVATRVVQRAGLPILIVRPGVAAPVPAELATSAARS